MRLTIWNEARQQQLRGFSDADFSDWNLSPIEKHGVHVKEFLVEPSGRAWVAKSGALAQEFPTDHDDAVERGRRIAFPINEAIAALLYRQAGFSMEVGLGIRTMFNSHLKTEESLFASFHEMQRGELRCKLGAIELTDRYTEDVLCVACIDTIMGQRDHKTHNYMVTTEGRLYPFDNSDCMHEQWVGARCDAGLFEDVRTYEPERPAWTDAFRRAVISRMASVTPEVVDASFAALPEAIVQAHDTSLCAGPYISASLREKRDHLKANLEVFRDWASSTPAV